VARPSLNRPSLNLVAQAAIAQELQGGLVLDSATLIERLMQHGYSYRKYVINLIYKAHQIGMIQRDGVGKNLHYRLTQDWLIDDAALAECTARMLNMPRRVLNHAIAPPSEQHPLSMHGPVFGTAPLLPSVGLVCGQTLEDHDGELPPYLGERIVESLHRRFDIEFGWVE
jgi:hypothetical protein